MNDHVPPSCEISSTDEGDNSQNFAFNFTAAQVVERFLEVFAKVSKRRLDEIEETYAESAIIKSLKSGKNLISGKENIRQSFLAAPPHPCSASRRIFVECKNGASFCFDLYPVGQSPGLGDPKKETVVLYRCKDSAITGVWGCVDKQSFASAPSLSLQDVTSSDLWALVLPIIKQDEPEFSNEQCHFNDYTNIEVWG